MIRPKALICLLLLAWCSGYSQKLVTEHKSSLSLSYGISSSMNPATFNSIPGLLENFQNGGGVEVNYDRIISKYFAAGATLGFYNFSSWSMPEARIYSHATLAVNTYEANFVLQTPFAEVGLRNRLRLMARISPGLYNVSADFPDGLNTLILGFTSSRPPLHSTLTHFGISAGVNLEITLTQDISLRLQATEHVVQTNSILYPDTQMKWLQLNFGVVANLKNNKRYLHDYKDQRR